MVPDLFANKYKPMSLEVARLSKRHHFVPHGMGTSYLAGGAPTA